MQGASPSLNKFEKCLFESIRYDLMNLESQAWIGFCIPVIELSTDYVSH